jgi:WD40 repeat protein
VPLLTLKGAWFDSVAFSPDGKRLVSTTTGESEGTPQGRRIIAPELKVWDAQTGEELLTLKGVDSTMAISPDGKRLASGRIYSLTW